MLKRTTSFIKKHLHFKLLEAPLIVVFLVLIGSIYYFISTLPSEKNNYIAQEISLLSKQSDVGSAPLYFDQNSNIKLENSSIEREIINFNTYNNSISGIKEYKQLVCANLDDKEVRVEQLEDKSPTVIMTSWSTYYHEKVTNDNIFISGLMVEGLGTAPVTNYSFCYINSKQANYLIQNNTKYQTYNDLINETIPIKISYNNKTETKDFTIRDIIKSDVGNDTRYKELFGSYIVCYYLPFLNTTKYQMFYDLAKDENRNLTKLNEVKNSYSPESYKLKFLHNVDETRAKTIEEEFLNIQTSKDNTTLIVILLSIPEIIFVFTVFFFCEAYKETRLSLPLLLFGSFTVIYLLLYILAKAKVLFAIRMFSPSAILFNFGFLILSLISIGISAFIKENAKFNRKYIHEKHD